ncbi:putative Holliday junction resolvase YqgF [Clostridiaceae bacterium JG1575]|nr:putative Holliday junction resolvase YqgF [Clostridiaceae bacterium JG1575]
MRVLCLDVGDRRIGVAVSDPTGFLATGLGTITRGRGPQEKEEAVGEVLSYSKQVGADFIVAGYPKNMDGTLGFQAQKVEDFLQELQKQCPLDIVRWDERLTTVSAHQTMAKKKTKIKKRKEEVDKIAACFILQSYLDSAAFKQRKERSPNDADHITKSEV